ncbi:MAG: hypothetical protein J3K34DRAFT_527240 [Monoraphidium minutum]|nr:MAG: hypothetical protein J3K34DRAFT_527240 [Monoraphidium minutum]
MIPEQRRRICRAALDVCAAVRAAVNALPLRDRAARVPALLKPPPEAAAAPDAAGERAAAAVLAGLAADLGMEVRIVVDPASGRCVRIRPRPAPATAPPPGGAPAAAAAAAQGAAAGEEETLELFQEDWSQEAPGPRGGSGGGGGDLEGAAGAADRGERVYVYLDAVDGTLLLSGLSNNPAAAPAPVLRLAGAGAWAVGVALTDAVRAPLRGLRLCDFSVAVIADGAAHGAAPLPGAAGGGGCGGALLHPTAALAVWEDADGPGGGGGGGGGEGGGGGGGGGGEGGGEGERPGRAWGPEGAPRLFTSSCASLGGSFTYLDAFQARDGATASPGAPRLAAALFDLLGDRRGGGAFDVVRAYGNLGALLRTFFGWRLGGGGGGGERPGAAPPGGGGDDEGGALWLEPQCGAFVVVNENLANLIPAVPLVLGAGGAAADLRGAPLAPRRLADGRASIAYAGNAALLGAVLDLARRAAEEAGNRRNLLLYAGGAAAVVAGTAALLGGAGGGGGGSGKIGREERAAIDALRDEGGFRREYDGHVWVQTRAGTWMEVRLDAKIPGTVLLRDEGSGAVYYLTNNNVQQFDLTDDYVVMALFGDGAWEDQIQRLQAREEEGGGGRLVDVAMDQEAFRDLISVMQD